MAPVRRDNKVPKKGTKKPGPKHSPLHKINAGRIGQSPDKHKFSAKNAGKELLPDVSLPNVPAAYFEDLSVRPNTQNVFPSFASTAPSAATPKSKARPKPKTSPSVDPRVKFLAEHNEKQRILKRVQDAIAKRQSMLTTDTDDHVSDARGEQTVPYSRARLDNILPTASGSSRMNIEVSIGFWGYTPTFTPGNLFSLTINQFSQPHHLQNIIYHSSDMIRAAKQVGIDWKADKDITIVGYEVVFAKGYRFKSINYTDIKNADPKAYIPIGSKVIINTDCALREFFLQSREFASDAYGNCQIPVIARLGYKVVDRFYGGESLQQFDHEMRSEFEYKWLAERRRIDLERQGFSDISFEKQTRARMDAIEEAANRAMGNKKVVKEDEMEVDENSAEHQAVISDCNKVVASVLGRAQAQASDLDFDIDFDID